jgi:uncharacterized small protein (DUF1192 family)
MKRKRRKSAKNRRRPTLNPKLSVQVGRSEPVLLAPVAEYRGVALIERPGKKRTVWKGREYFSNGCIYMMRRSHLEGQAELIGWPSEAIAKAFIEEQCEHELGQFYSFVELEEVIGVTEEIRRIHAQLEWEWDQKQQVFVEAKNRTDIRAQRGVEEDGAR